jgi:hypothetical protein
VSWENANLSAFGQERHSPLQHNEKSIGKTNQRVDVYSQAGNPEKRRNLRSATANERPTIAKSPLSQYTKGLGGLRSEDATVNQVCHIAPLLNGRLGHAR